MTKWRKIRTIWYGLSMRQKLQNSKGYNAESPEFLPVLGQFIFKKKSVATT